MSKPQVLIFIDWYLPGTNAGGPVRSCANLVDQLSHKIDFSIVTSDTDYMKRDPYPDVESDTWNEGSNGLRVWYASKGNAKKEVFESLINEREYDAFYINGIYSRQYSIMPLRLLQKAGLGEKTVVAVRGMLAKGAMRFGTFKKKAFLAVAKFGGLYKGVTFQATDPIEVKDIKQHIGANTDVERIANLPRVTKPEKVEINKTAGHLKVICLARIAVEKNNLFAIQSLQNVDANIELTLCGSIYDKDYWKTCEKTISQLPANITVVHRDAVRGSEVPRLLAQYHMLYLPTLGENFGHVIFESMCVGHPVLISDRTPWTDLEQAKAGVALSLEDPNGFKDALERFANMDRSEYDAYCTGAYEYALRYLEQDETADRYLDLFSK